MNLCSTQAALSKKLFRRRTWMSLTSLSNAGALRLLGATPGALLFGVRNAARQRFERHWSERWRAQGAVAFPSARSSITALLVASDIGPGDEVLVTGYTCEAVAEGVTASGATPVWVDIDPTRLSMSPEAAKNAIGHQTRAMIIQHTFGIPAESAPLIEIARENDMFVLEDAALAVGSAAPEGPLGSFGDASVYSFEVSKRISAGWGGLAQINRGDIEVRLREIRNDGGSLPRIDLTRRLVHAALGRFALSPHAPSILGYGMAGLSRIGVLHDSETYTGTQGIDPESDSAVPARYYAGQAGQHWSELDRQLNGLFQITRRARTISDRYVSVLRSRGVELPASWTEPGVKMVRFPVMCSAPDLLLEGLTKAGVEGGKWFDYPIAPRPEIPGSYNYEPGRCPIGEWVGQHMANLPLHSRLSDGDVDAVCSALDDFISSRDGEPEFMAAAASGRGEPIEHV